VKGRISAYSGRLVKADDMSGKREGHVQEERRFLMRNAVALFIVGVFGLLCPLAAADTIMIGNSNGEIFGRDEFALGTHIPASYVNFAIPVTSMAGGVDWDVAIGLGDGSPHVRKSFDLVNTGVPTTNFTGTNSSSISAIATRPDGHVVIGTQDDQVFVRDRTNLLALAPGYTGPNDGLHFNNDITALATLSTGDVVIGNANGEVFVRSGNNLYATAPGAAVDNINFGVPISALAVTPSDNVVIGLQNGLVDVRPMSNLAASLTSVNFGLGITGLGALSTGDVAIGLANGQVHVRDSADLVNGVVTWAAFTGGAPITALTVTSNDNVAIGTGDNLVFVRRGDDLTLTPPGFQGSDGLNFNAPIGALASAVPEPATLGLLALGWLAALRRRRR